MKERILKLLCSVRTFVVDFFKYDRWFKLISVAAAVALWLFMGAQNPETSRTYRDVEIDILTNLTGENALSLIYSEETQAAVTATAKRATLLNVSALDFDLSVDATDIKSPGIYTLGINASSRVSDVTIDRITPSKTEVRLDYLITKTFPIVLKTDDKLGDGYVFGDAELSVDHVTVTGPQTELDRVSEVYAVLRIDEEKPVSEQLALRYVDVHGENVDTTYFRTDTSKVDVKMNIYAKKTVELYADVDCTDSSFDRDMFSVSVSPSTAEIYGLPGDIEGIDKVSVGTFMSRELKSGSFEAKALLPDGLYSENEIDVTVKVDLGILRDMEIRISDIRFIGLSEEYEARADSNTVTVSVRSDVVLTENDVYLTLDMTGLGEGTHEAKPSLGFKNGFKGDMLGELTLRAVVRKNDNY